MMRKMFFVFGVALTLLLATTPVFADETLWLDTYDATDRGFAGPVWTSGVLETGKEYRIAIQGTYSLYFPSSWSNACGAPEPAPIYPSPAVQNGTVGGDAAYWFATLGGEPLCASLATAPHYQTLVQFNLDGNALDWVLLVPRETAYQANHLYTYTIIGQGTRVGFRFWDWPTSDDYGMFRIVVKEQPRILIPLLMKNP